MFSILGGDVSDIKKQSYLEKFIYKQDGEIIKKVKVIYF